MRSSLQSFRRHFYRDQVVGIAIIVVIAGIGTYFLVISHAASPFASSEAESGTLSSLATKIPDSGASNDTAVQFGNSGTKAPGIYVAGNKLVNGKGQTITLHGVNVVSAEWSCIQDIGFFQQPVDQTSVSAIAAWHANVVRLAVNEDCWLGINGVPPQYSGQNYVNAITNYVNLLNQNGIYVILSLQIAAPGTNVSGLSGANGGLNAPMPDQDHAPAFWTNAATNFKNNHAVLFDLYNEPWPDSNNDSNAAWICWKDGGSCSGVTYNGVAYQAAGMQELVTTVRNTGASNVLLLGGTNFAYKFDQWLAMEPTDPDNQLAASFHTYFDACPVNSDNPRQVSTSACYDSFKAGVGAQVPIITGELGDTDCNTDPNTQVVPYMDWADANDVSYVGWGWYSGSCGFPDLLSSSDSNYTGVPSTLGAGFQQHYLATFSADSPIQ